MATINKDDILYRWLVEGLQHALPMTFEFLQMVDGWAAVAPISGVRAVKTYINGDAIKQYDFMLQIAFTASDDAGSDRNTSNVLTLREWQDWIDAQQDAGDYPDFGEKCSQYKLENLANMPTMAGRQDDGLAKYQFPARLTYLEVK